MSSLISKEMKVQAGGFSLQDAWKKAKQLASSVHDTMKKRKVISGAMKSLGWGPVGTFVDKQFGYGQIGGSVAALEKAVEKEFGVKVGGRRRRLKVVADKKPVRRRIPKTRVPRSVLPIAGVPAMVGGKGSPVMKIHI